MDSAKNVLKYLLIGLIVLGLGVAIGYNYLPATVITQTQVVEKVVEKIVTKIVTDIDRTITETKKPDGTIITETKEKSKTVTDSNTDKVADKKEDTKTTKEYAGRWRTNVLYKQNLSDMNKDVKNFGVGVEYRILGPINVGGFGFLDKTVGVSIGIGF